MAWPDEQHAEWDLELQRMRYGFSPTTDASNGSRRPPSSVDANVDMERAHPPAVMQDVMGATNEFMNTGGNTHAPSMTYSASCPSFSSLYELSSDDDLIRDIQAGGAHHQHQQMNQHTSGFMTGNMTSAHQHPQHLQQQHFNDPELGPPSSALNSGMPPQFAVNDKSYDFLLQMQQEHLDASLRQYPHQQTQFQPPPHAIDHFALFNQPRRPLHASASFTSLSSMETEYRRQSVSKRKKGGERWYKMQRHKSFDSTTTSPATSMEFSAYSGASSQFESTPEHNFLEEVPDADMIGFSIDDFPSTFTSDASWPMPLTLGGGIPFDAYTADAGSAGVPSAATTTATTSAAAADLLDPAALHEQPGQRLASSEDTSEDKAASSADNQSPADIDLLLSDQERANMSSLFDAIRDFESPPQPAPVAPTNAAATTSTTPKTTTGTQARPRARRGSSASSASKKKTNSPPLHPSLPRASSFVERRKEKPFSLLSSSPPVAQKTQPVPVEPTTAPVATTSATYDKPRETPSATELPVRERLQQLLTRHCNRDPERTQLTDTERTYLESSPLFQPHKASETAGSLWLILHAARCEFGCDIAGCNVMRRVVKHCLGCDVIVGKCRDPCNEAKTMMLHFGSCSSSSDAEKGDCGVCRKLKEIDQAHNAIKNSPRLTPTQSVTAATPPFMSIPMTPRQQQLQQQAMAAAMGRVPIASQPKFGSSPNLRPLMASNGSGSGASKHVPIQPNPLPTSSNPMGLMGSFPHFGYSLSLYLEQTSAAFRAEVKARVEKRVTSAAGQDLIQHMQKKTRLRSLDDLRSDARTLVLGELERELHFHMQAYSWASANNNSNNGGGSENTNNNNSPQLGGLESPLPPYLLSVAAAGFAAFYAQQASFHAAMTGMTATGGNGVPGTNNNVSYSSTPPTAVVATASRRKVSFGGNSSSASTPTSAIGAIPSSSALKTGMATSAEKKTEAALAV